jgi:transcriptional regulator GlxA family with amidase domain
MCLHMLARDHGAAAAAQVAQTTLTGFDRPSGQARLIRQPLPGRGGELASSREWALRRLDQPVTVR